MRQRSAHRFRLSLRLIGLENRLLPAGINALVSKAEPSLDSDTGGSDSFIYSASAPAARWTQTLSSDGRFAVFASKAANLVAGQSDANDVDDIFVYDRTTNTTELISHKAGSTLLAGTEGGASLASISADGRYVTFVSNQIDLVAGISFPFAPSENVYLYDRLNDSCTLVSHAFDNPLAAGSYNSTFPMISADGSVVAFSSESVNLLAGFPNPGGSHISAANHAYVFERSTGVVTVADHKFGAAGSICDGVAEAVDISPDGRYILLSAGATNLLATTTGDFTNIYRYDRVTGTNVLVSGTGGGSPSAGNAQSSLATMSADGKWVAFATNATNLVSGASGPAGQVFLGDVEAGTVSIISHSTLGLTVGGNGFSQFPSISPDGKYVAYLSKATNLLSGFVDGNDSSSYDTFLYDRLAHQTTLVSHQPGSVVVSGNGASSSMPKISNDGGTITFASVATNLITGFIDGNGATSRDLFKYDRSTGNISLVSGVNGSTTLGGNREARFSSLNADGSVVGWNTAASDMKSGIIDTNGAEDVFVRDYGTNMTVLASRRAAPALSAGGSSEWFRQSADGRYVVFASTATNLAPGQIDTEQSQDIFLTDRQTSTTILVSRVHGTTASAANDPSSIPVISGDGRYVAYASSATNLVPGFIDSNGLPVDSYSGTDIYLFDRLTGSTTLVSHQAGNPNAGGNYTSGTPAIYLDYMLCINDDGRYVGYFSLANNLVAGFVDNNGTITSNRSGADIYLFDRVLGTNTVASHAAGAPLSGSNGSCYQAQISADGRFVTYWSSGENMVAGMSATTPRNIFVYDRQQDTTSLVSHAASSSTAVSNGGSADAVISKNGNFIVYNSVASNLVDGLIDVNNSNPGNAYDVYLYDRQAGTNTLVSHKHNSLTTTGDIYSSVGSVATQFISDDGRFVVFQSGARDLVAGFVDNNGGEPNGIGITGAPDSYLYDRLTGVVTLVSHSASSMLASGNRHSYAPQISGDGRFLAYFSEASDLVAGYTQTPGAGYGDLYLFDRLTGKNVLISHNKDNPLLGADSNSSGGGILSHNGAVIGFGSRASDLVAGDFNTAYDIFAYVQLPPTVLAVQFNDGSDQRSMVKQIVVTFSEPVSFMGSIASAFTLHRQGSVGDVTLAANPASGPVSSVTITFSGSFVESSGSLVDGRYDFIIDAAQVSGVAGALDGNSDGIAGGSYVINGTAANMFYRLFGDSDGDGTVSQLPDFTALANATGNPSSIFDFDNDGTVDQDDFIKFRNNFGGVV